MSDQEPMPFKDHFSGHATAYRRFRPDYPPVLFASLAALAPGRRRAWDCATGNGQAALRLADHFAEVIATDASERQIAEAVPHPKVHYRHAPAEASGLPDGGVDLVMVAQALHWLDFDRFFAEVERVLVPGGVLATSCYLLTRVRPAIDSAVDRLYSDVVGAYWPPERRYIEEEYRTIPFPFEEIELPPFTLEVAWNLATFRGYLGTWSASRRFVTDRGSDPLAEIDDELALAWGPPEKVRPVRWPLVLRTGRKAFAAPT